MTSDSLMGGRTLIPDRSPGLLVAPFLEGSAVYDLVEHRVVLVSALGGVVLVTAPAGRADLVDDLVDDLVKHSGLASADASVALDRTVDELLDAGLLGRETPWEPPTPVVASTEPDDTRHVSNVQHLLHHRLAFRSSDPELVAEVERLLGIPTSTATPTVYFDVEPDPGGGVLVRAAEDWEFPDRRGFRIQLPGVVNDFASRTSEHLVMHAGGVRTPDGRVMLLPGAPEAGKSTFTAALVMAGCDYLGDELIGVREGSLAAITSPVLLSLDDVSRAVLGLRPTRWGGPRPPSDGEHRHDGEGPDALGGSPGTAGPYCPVQDLRPDAATVRGEAGPVAEILLPGFDPEATALERSPLGPRDALEALLPAVMNLARCGDDGWATLCQMAERVPVHRVRYPDAVDAARLRLRPGEQDLHSAH